MIEVRNLTKVYGDVLAVDGISFEINVTRHSWKIFQAASCYLRNECIQQSSYGEDR